MDITFTSSADLQTLEEYGIALVAGMINLRSLEAYHIKALQLGILDTDATELSKTICWELRRLMKLYMQQSEDVFELIPDSFTADDAIKLLQGKFMSENK